MRVVSLVPSATETLVAWGCPPVACTLYCEQPDIRSVGGTKNPRVLDIVDLSPDVVVMCHEENREVDAEALRAVDIPVHVCSPATVAEVAPSLRDLASAVGAAPGSGDLGGPVVYPEPIGVRAFVPIWRRPWMTITGGTYGTSLLDAIGVSNVAEGWTAGEGSAGRYPEVDLDRVAAEAPDLVLVPSEPYDFKDEHLDDLRSLAPVRRIDGRDLFWWGVRTPKAVERLHRVVRRALLNG
ncbi:MAG: hypothetical protein KDB02_09045 [Acidimicrobiales bacterium]|nr:hypothetical protein [Acidimicrobiales bacterium]